MKRFVTLTASAVLGAGESPDVAFVPPMVRRRLSLLQKIYFSLANSVCSRPPAGAVFASRDGEDGLTRRIVDSFNGDGTVSPYQFSASVYNAAPGLWSVHTKNRSPYTAVAAGDDTVECGLLETFGAPAPALFVYAEETGGGYGAAFSVEEEGSRGRKIEITAGVTSSDPVSFDGLAAFLSGKTRVLAGRWITLREV